MTGPGSRPRQVDHARPASTGGGQRLCVGCGFSGYSLGADGRALDLDGDLLADQYATGLERLVPGEAEVLAVDLGLGREAEDVLAPRVGGGAAELDVEGDLLGHVPDGEVTDDLELVAGVLGDPLAPEGDLRELVGREEVVAPEVSVAVGDPGVDARGLDDGLDAGLERVLGDDDLALELAEVPADLAHHHVPDDEADPGVGLIEHEVA